MGCWKTLTFFLFALTYVIFLANAPQAALVLGIVLVAAYFFVLKAKSIAAKREEREKRKRALVLARQQDDLYEYNPSIQALPKRSVISLFESPRKWSRLLQERYEDAQRRLLYAEVALNDDIDQLTQHRKKLQSTLLPEYEMAINPFFDELESRKNSITLSPELRAVVDFQYPKDSTPNQVKKDLDKVISNYSRSVISSLSGKNLSKLQATDVASVAVITAINGITYLSKASDQRRKLEQAQGDIDSICEQISGAIKTYGVMSKNIQNIKRIYDASAAHIRERMIFVKQLASTEKRLSEMEESDRMAIEAFYKVGQMLKKAIEDCKIVEPIERNI